MGAPQNEAAALPEAGMKALRAESVNKSTLPLCSIHQHILLTCRITITCTTVSHVHTSTQAHPHRCSLASLALSISSPRSKRAPVACYTSSESYHS